MNSPDSSFLRRAEELAYGGVLRVEPNPLVGCVIVRNGRIVGEGCHRHWGGPHAEANALAEAGQDARGGIAYVTLEPCAHHGKTPPCADALIAAGISEVVYSNADGGIGRERLRAADVRVRKARSTKLGHTPREIWVIAKWAMTLDGRIASRTGDSRWITSAETRAWSHRELRGHVDAIVAGAGTIRTDDPRLTNRSGAGLRPLRVVVCGTRRLPVRARVLGKRTLLAVPTGFAAPRGADVLRCGRHGRVDLRRLLKGLANRGCHRVLIEGGGTLLGSFFDRGLVNQVAVLIGASIIGGASAPGPVGGKGLPAMALARGLDNVRVHDFGFDRVIEGYVA